MLLLTVPARVRRDLSAVGKMPEKSRSQKLQLYFPGTIPRQGEALPCSAPPGGTPSLPFDLLVREISSRSRSAVPLQIEATLSEMDLHA